MKLLARRLMAYTLVPVYLISGLPAAAGPRADVEVEAEKPDDPPASFEAKDLTLARSISATVVQGPYQSVQVNVDSLGNNIVGDAANEPSIAVHPANPANKVVGWRQFNSVTSNFRQAGWAYTFNGGQSWTFPGVLQPGVFRSDPVLDTDSQGTFYYQSLKADFTADVWRSTNGGVSWLAPVSEFGGDKNWFVVDKSGGASDGQLYGIWQRFASCCGENVLTRSTDGGASYQAPVPVLGSPTFGTLAVGPNGELYAAGIDGTVTQDLGHFVAATSTNASNPAATPTFTGGRVNLVGGMKAGTGPNPQGLLGQANVSADRSNAATRGNAYVGASVAGADPMDVRIARSTDRGASWSSAARVNDDASQSNWQWLAAHSVSPNGRIDVVWNDSRATGQPNMVQLYYSYSWDGGVSWSPNVPVSPVFNSLVGFPNQSKMGDYNGIVSGDTGADVAYAATFNNEQDVWYLRVFPDCNANGVSDVTDVAAAASVDCDANHVPDECEATVCGPSLIFASSSPAAACSVGGPGNSNGAVDPGEDVALPVLLRNDGTVSLTNVSATVSTSTPGVTVTRSAATYPDIASHASSSSNTPHFAFNVGTAFPCGGMIDFTVAATSAQGSWVRAFSVRVGRQAVTRTTFPSTDVPKPIADLTKTTSTVTFAGGSLVDLDVSVNLTHSYDGDLVLVLIDPDGRRSLLAYSEGDGGQNYSDTIFNDEAGTSIEDGVAPFVGPFRPRQALSSFDGAVASGAWSLEIEDIGPGDTGTLTSWALTRTVATGFTCSTCNVGAPALEPTAVAWSSGAKASLEWQAIPGATFYNTYRGVPAGFASLLTAAPDSCLRSSTIGTTTGAVLSETPPEGSLFWYLVRAANGAGEGPPGSASAGPRSQQSTGTCP